MLSDPLAIPIGIMKAVPPVFDCRKQIDGNIFIPRCKLFNPPDAFRCDCGYDFASGKMDRSYDPKLAKNMNELLSFGETVNTALSGAGLGLLGLFFVWPRASRFKSEGYILKSKKSWQVYWFAFSARLAAMLIFIIVVLVRSR